jgi:hypothetical protein
LCPDWGYINNLNTEVKENYDACHYYSVRKWELDFKPIMEFANITFLTAGHSFHIWTESAQQTKVVKWDGRHSERIKIGLDTNHDTCQSNFNERHITTESSNWCKNDTTHIQDVWQQSSRENIWTWEIWLYLTREEWRNLHDKKMLKSTLQVILFCIIQSRK